jgi:hypothetical protein
MKFFCLLASIPSRITLFAFIMYFSAKTLTLTSWLYHKVNTNDLHETSENEIEVMEKDTLEELKQYRVLAHPTKNYMYAFLATLIILLVVGMAYQLGAYRHPGGSFSGHGSPYPCGNSSAEAVSLGCTFDQLMWAWYPHHCSHYANDEFVKAEPELPWRYYDNLYNGSIVHPEDDNWLEILDSGVQLWSERREHLTHCIYMFLSAGRIARGGTRHVPKILSEDHFEHCAAVLLDALRQDSKWYEIETKVPSPAFDQSC